jgi:hypothetical protein
MFPFFKKVKVFKPHCPVCKEMLGGDNSFISPYVCSCGVWKWTNLDDRSEFEIIE